MSTPFGIRRRLKRLLGIDPGPVTASSSTAAPAPAPVGLTLVGPDGGEQSCTAAPGSTVLATSGKLRRPLASGCADSTCGTCRVEVLEGAEHLSPHDGRERATLRENGLPDAYRLACRTEIVSGSVKVRGFELI